MKQRKQTQHGMAGRGHVLKGPKVLGGNGQARSTSPRLGASGHAADRMSKPRSLSGKQQPVKRGGGYAAARAKAAQGMMRSSSPVPMV